VVPGEVGCRLQEGVQPCNSGMPKEDHLQENPDAHKFWTAGGSDSGR
jgi:hypothetical protein